MGASVNVISRGPTGVRYTYTHTYTCIHSRARLCILSRATPLSPLAKKMQKKSGTKKLKFGRGLGGECGLDVKGKEDTYTHRYTCIHVYTQALDCPLSRDPLRPFRQTNANKKKRNKRIKFGERVRGRSRERRKTVSKNKYRILGSYK